MNRRGISTLRRYLMNFAVGVDATVESDCFSVRRNARENVLRTHGWRGENAALKILERKQHDSIRLAAAIFLVVNQPIAIRRPVQALPLIIGIALYLYEFPFRPPCCGHDKDPALGIVATQKGDVLSV